LALQCLTVNQRGVTAFETSQQKGFDSYTKTHAKQTYTSSGVVQETTTMAA
jgi:hypothetical protein